MHPSSRATHLLPRRNPDYYDALRPAPTGLPRSISYGGPYFNLTLPREKLVHTTFDHVKVVLIPTGFSTHAIKCAFLSPADLDAADVAQHGTTIRSAGE